MQVVEGTLRGLLWFCGLLIMVAAITVVRKIVTYGIGAGSMVELIIFQIPRIILFALPMSVLFGTVQAFTELSTESEITALSAGGMSLPRMIVAPLGWGAVLAVFAFLLQELVVPGAQMRVDSTTLAGRAKVGGKTFQWVDPPPGKGPVKRVIQADRLDTATGTLIKPRIQIYNEAGLVKVQIEAERGQWDLKTNQWQFINSSITHFNRNQFGNWVGVTLRSKVTQRDVAPSLGKMTRSNTDARAATDASNYEYVSITDVIDYREEMQKDAQEAKNASDRDYSNVRVKSATFGIHDKIATPLVVLFMVLIGAPLGLRPPRAKGQGGVALGVSLAVLILYYIIWTWCTTVGKSGYGNPVMFAYLSPFLTFAAGLFLLIKKSR